MSGSKTSGVRANAHPLYTKMLEVWELGHDSYDGEDAIKDKRTIYLPETASMRLDGFGTNNPEAEGEKAYQAYITRAFYPEVFADAVDSAIGVMHRKPANIQLTPKLEVLLEQATDDGEDLHMLLRRINAHQLTTGRVCLVGMLREMPDGTARPVLIAHDERAAFNWDDTRDAENAKDLRLLCIDESDNVLTTGMTWTWKNRVRVLALIDPTTNELVKLTSEGAAPGVYGTALLEDGASLGGANYEPLSYKGTTFPRLPAVFINAKDLSAKPDKPPLHGLAKLALAIYRGEADYRQNLFMQGQDTLVRIGAVDEEETLRTGAGARIDVPVQGDAKYIGVSGDGLSEQRESLKSDYEKADKKASKLMSNGSGQESGEALKIRVAAQTATLPQVALTGAAGLEKVLRDLAEWLGDNPEDVVVTPNLEFTDASGDGLTLTQIITAKGLGAPISDKSIHAWMVEQGFTAETYDDELALLNEEEPRL